MGREGSIMASAQRQACWEGWRGSRGRHATRRPGEHVEVGLVRLTGPRTGPVRFRLRRCPAAGCTAVRVVLVGCGTARHVVFEMLSLFAHQPTSRDSWLRWHMQVKRCIWICGPISHLSVVSAYNLCTVSRARARRTGLGCPPRVTFCTTRSRNVDERRLSSRTAPQSRIVRTQSRRLPAGRGIRHQRRCRPRC